MPVEEENFVVDYQKLKGRGKHKGEKRKCSNETYIEISSWIHAFNFTIPSLVVTFLRNNDFGGIFVRILHHVHLVHQVHDACFS